MQSLLKNYDEGKIEEDKNMADIVSAACTYKPSVPAVQQCKVSLRISLCHSFEKVDLHYVCLYAGHLFADLLGIGTFREAGVHHGQLYHISPPCNSIIDDKCFACEHYCHCEHNHPNMSRMMKVRGSKGEDMGRDRIV